MNATGQTDIDDEEDEDPIRMSEGIKDEDELDITPMIDITFLLLIFFVVASKMDPTQTGRTPKATHGLSVSAKDSAVLFMSAGSGERAIIKNLDGAEFSSDEETQISEIVEYVTEELDRGKQQVMILGDEDVRVGEVTRVQTIIGDAFEDLDATYIAVQED
jgi:biopolymer transport protein ExbD